MKNHEEALEGIQLAAKLDPKRGTYRVSLAGILRKLGRGSEAQEQIKIARELMTKESEYGRACFESICGNADEALALLKVALEKKQQSLEWARSDPDFDFIREDARFKALVGISPNEPNLPKAPSKPKKPKMQRCQRCQTAKKERHPKDKTAWKEEIEMKKMFIVPIIALSLAACGDANRDARANGDACAAVACADPGTAHRDRGSATANYRAHYRTRRNFRAANRDAAERSDRDAHLARSSDVHSQNEQRIDRAARSDGDDDGLHAHTGCRG